MQFVSYFFFLNTDDTQCNARMTSETLLINCSSRVHISFTVYFGLAFASSLRFAFAYRSACAHCSNGKVKCFRDCSIKQWNREISAPFCFHPFSPCVGRRNWDWVNSNVQICLGKFKTGRNHLQNSKNNRVYCVCMHISNRPHLSLQTIAYSKQCKVTSIVRSCYKSLILKLV